MVALPSQLFYNTMIPACLWFIARDKQNNKFRARGGEVLFIDARNFGVLVDRRHRELTFEDIRRISDTYHSWRGELVDGKEAAYKDVLGFCNSARLNDVRNHGYILTPGRYVGAQEEEEDGKTFDEKMKNVSSELKEQMITGQKLDEEIKKNLLRLGY
jgi:type I restriction enzyme M protein